MKNKKLSPYLIILCGFLMLILVGTLLLKLPFATTNKISWVDSLFTATSAVCVTGLSAIDIASTFTVFGKIIIALLIQLGGLGIVTLAALILILVKAKIGIRERVLIKEALNQNTLQGLVKLIKKILLTTIIIELIGTILNMFVFIKDYNFIKALGYSVFHAISSFNNAGFVIFSPTSESLIAYNNNFLLNFSTCLLIILGGIGYIVIFDLINFFKTKKINIHTKIVLITTLILLIIPTLFFKYNSNLTFMEAFFHSVSLRTAGFSSINILKLTTASYLASIFLMFIGTSPVSTGGGIKTTTFFTLIITIISFGRGKETVAFKRKISQKSIHKALLITILFISYIFISVFLISIKEPNLDILKITFEVVSAISTCGLSLGITALLSTFSKLILCSAMFLGRVGLLSIVSLLNKRWNAEIDSSISYVEEKIIIG